MYKYSYLSIVEPPTPLIKPGVNNAKSNYYLNSTIEITYLNNIFPYMLPIGPLPYGTLIIFYRIPVGPEWGLINNYNVPYGINFMRIER